MAHISFAHVAGEELIEGDDGGVLDVEVRGHPAQLCDIQVAAVLIKASHLAALQLTGCIRDELDAVALESRIRRDLLPADAIVQRVAQHADKKVGVAQPQGCLLHICDGTCNMQWLSTQELGQTAMPKSAVDSWHWPWPSHDIGNIPHQYIHAHHGVAMYWPDSGDCRCRHMALGPTI